MDTVNPEALESAGLVRPKQPQKQQTSTESDKQSTATLQAIAAKRKATRKLKKKKRLPKNINPNVPIDPERWISKVFRIVFCRRGNH